MTPLPTGTHIVFRLANDIPDGMKTAIWLVLDKAGGVLGQVKWFGRWRKYSFFPMPDCVFEGTCLREIARFIEDQTRAHRNDHAPRR